VKRPAAKARREPADEPVGFVKAPRRLGAKAPSTSFWPQIYGVVARIPRGRVATYGQVAAVAGLPRQARLVGYAMFGLPTGSKLPWHRVINARGEVSARSDPGPSEALQRHLLEREGVRFDERGRVSLKRYRWDPDATAAPAASRRRRASR
jgi:methylated-DNA-protein-cysteine methyltransferase related protein